MNVRLILILVVLPVLFSQTAFAQKEKKSEALPPDQVESAKAKAEVEGFWPVDALTETAVKRIAFRYNLNQQQTEFTREMMNEGVKKFLDEHQEDIWPLIRDLAYYQRQGQLPDANAAKRLGPVALNILGKARDEIFRYNEEWGEILTPDQKRVHDYDMREMQRTFEMMHGNFDNWQNGNLENAKVFPTAPRLMNEPPRPKMPEHGTTDVKRDRRGLLLDSHFDAYADKFIRDYQLTPPQQETVQSILREIKKRSADFRTTNKKELDAIKKALATARTPEKRRQIDAKRKELTAPLDDLFQQFKSRLDTVPDKAQRERFQEKDWRALPRATTRRAKAESRNTETPVQEAKKPAESAEEPG